MALAARAASPPTVVVHTRTSRARRAVDVVLALVLLVLSAPLLLFGVLAVLLGSGRPIFFGHVRLGLAGRSFRCWKLRTMTVGAERRLLADPDLRRRHAGNGYKLPLNEDPRLTSVGPWLRRSHLDELPQLFNVLNGTMSLFGPRPIVEEELRHYGDDMVDLLAAKPGLLGEWTSLGRRRPPYPERTRLELAYVRDPSVARDLRILLRSIPVLLRGQES